MAEISIIPLAMKPELVDACAAWSYGEWGSQVPTRSLLQVHQDYIDNIDQHSLPLTFVATSDGKPVGMVRLKEIDPIEREDLKPWLSSLYVHPRYRGKNIAGALCEHVHGIAREVYGYEKIYLFTGLAQPFYEKIGYTRIGTMPDRSGFLEDGKALMMKNL